MKDNLMNKIWQDAKNYATSKGIEPCHAVYNSFIALYMRLKMIEYGID